MNMTVIGREIVMPNRKPWTIYFLATATVLSLISVSLIATTIWPRPVDASTIGHFKDIKDLQAFVDSQTKISSLLGQMDQSIYPVFRGGVMRPLDTAETPAASAAPSAVASGAANSSANGTQTQSDFSTTNDQVAGVDEADIVKSDGSDLDAIAGNKIDILAAYPPEKAQVLSSLTFDNPPTGLFVNGNRMLVIVQQEPVIMPMIYNAPAIVSPGIYPLPIRFNQPQGVTVAVYDTSDKTSPQLLDSFSINGASYVTSRMIGSYVYLIVNVPLDLGDGTGQGDVQLPGNHRE